LNHGEKDRLSFSPIFLKKGDSIMAYRISTQAGKVTYNLKELIADTYNDISKINVTSLAPGSTVFVIDTSECYMLNSKKEWKLVHFNCVYDGEGVEPPSNNDCILNEDHIIWDGGVVINE
jgi:hypothetical protein